MPEELALAYERILNLDPTEGGLKEKAEKWADIMFRWGGIPNNIPECIGYCPN